MPLTIKLALKNIKREKKKSLLIAFLYFVSAVFFVTEALLTYNFYLSNERRLDNTYGTHDGIFLCDKIDTINQIKAAPEISNVGVINVKASAVRGEDWDKYPITIGTADNTAIELNKISLTEGNFPVLTDEIALEQSFLNFNYPNVKVGDEIQMQLKYPNSEKITFTLCGVLNDISNLQWNTENGKPPMINGLVSAGLWAESEIYSFASIEYMGKEAPLSDFADTLTQNDGVLFYLENQRSSLDYFGIIDQNNGGSIIILIIFLLVFTVIILLSITYIYKRGNAQIIGLLKTSGFSINSIILFFAAKFLLLLFPSVLLGIFSGLGLSVFFSGGNGEFHAVQKAPLIMFVSAVLTVLILILSLIFGIKKECKKSVVENLRIYEADLKTALNVNLHTDNPVWLYAIKNFILNGKETASTCVMIFLSVIISFVGIFVYSDIKITAEENSPICDFSLSFPEEYVTVMSTYRNNYLGIMDNEYEALKANNEVKDIVGIKKFMFYELTKDEVDYRYEAPGSDVENFIKFKDSFGFPKDYNIRTIPLMGVDNDILERLKKYVVAGKIDLNALSSGQEVVVCRQANGNDFKYSVGDTIKLANVLNTNPDAFSTSEMSLFETEVKVGALVEYNDDSDCKVIRNRLCGLVWAESAFEKTFGFKFNYRDVFITVADKNYYNSLSSMINELDFNYSSSEPGRNDSIVVDNMLQRTKKFEEAYNSFISISLLIASGLALFSLISIISAIMTKLIKRKRIFGFLRAVGLTKKQMFQIILSENIISVVVSFLLGAACGFVLCSIMSNSVSCLTSPFLIISISLLIYMIAIVIICFILSYRSFKTTIIEQIRYNDTSVQSQFTQ